jgi:hypothetical protein
MPTPSPSPSPAPTVKGPGDEGLAEEERRSFFLKGYEEGIAAGLKRASRGRRPVKAIAGRARSRPPYAVLTAIGGLFLGIVLARALF